MAKLFRWLLMAAGGHRFARVWAGIRNAFRARATAAPTADAAAHNASGGAGAAKPSTVPMEDGSARQGLFLGLLARGESGRIVLARLWAGVRAAVRAVAVAIPAVAAAVLEVWATALRAAADSVPTTSGSMVPAGQETAHRADPDAVETVLPGSAWSSGGAMSADPDTAAAAEAEAAGQDGTGLYARARTWCEPVVIGGVLYLRQAVEATVENGILEVR